MTLTEIFLEVENKRDLLSKQVEGYYFWAYDRYAIYEAYRINEKGHTIAHESLPGNKQIFSYCKNILATIKGYRLLSKFNKSKEKSVVVLAHPRRNLINGLYYSIYTDLIIPKDWNVYTFEKTDYYTHHKPAASKNIIYLDWIELKSKIKYLYEKNIHKAKYNSFLQQIKETTSPILDDLTQLTGIKVDQDNLINSMVSHYFVVSESLIYWDKLLSHNNVSSIVEVVSYDLFIMAANQKAKQYNIPIVEIQHGMLSSIHIAYQYHKDSNPLLTPDYIFTFSDYWSKEINIPHTKMVPIGFENFNQQRAQHPKHSSHNNIVVVSQGNVGRILSKIATDIAKTIEDNSLEITIYYKLHPGEFNSAQQIYPDIFNSSVIKVIRNEINIYDLFADSCIQIGYNSTAIFEGFGYNLKTFLIEDGDPFMQKLISDGVASLYESAHQVINSLTDKAPVSVEDKIWAYGSKEKFVKAMTTIY